MGEHDRASAQPPRSREISHVRRDNTLAVPPGFSYGATRWTIVALSLERGEWICPGSVCGHVQVCECDYTYTKDVHVDIATALGALVHDVQRYRASERMVKAGARDVCASSHRIRDERNGIASSETRRFDCAIAPNHSRKRRHRATSAG